VGTLVAANRDRGTRNTIMRAAAQQIRSRGEIVRCGKNSSEIFTSLFEDPLDKR
jgi:hypothetical protein